MKKINELANKYLRNNFTICDVGAAGGISKRWLGINNLFVIGFEPDSREFEQLIDSSRQKWFNIGLNHSTGIFPIYITKYQTNTSLYKPNFKFINRMCYRQDDFKIERELNVECDTLDNIIIDKNFNLDFIKLDTQGSELDILKGCESVLNRDIFAVEVEVEFAELYENQPLFADVDIFMRSKNFILMDLGNMVHLKGRNTVGKGGPKAFLISSDALYFKSIDECINLIQNNGIDKLFNIVVICLKYGYTDYALEVCYKLLENDLFSNDIRLAELIDDLEKFKLPSEFIPEFKLKGYFHKFFILVAKLFMKTKNVSWINDLGNN
jgi:FkbM family methyltransferase